MADRLIAGRYRIERLLGEGGIARVYSAIDTLSGHTVAVKKIRQDDRAVLDSLIEEYRFASLNRHPSLVSPFSLARERKTAFLIQPLVEGVEIGAWWRDEAKEESDRRLALAGILESVAFMHFAGYLHNDFKPANMLIIERTAEGGSARPEPIVLDYNLVSRRGESPTKRGTIEYMAPEMLLGDQPAVSSDLYSIGAAFYEIFTGRAPLTSTDDDTLIKLITEEGTIDFSDIPGEYRAGLISLLSRDPGSRPRNAREAAAALSVGREFDELYRSRIGFYLSAGLPPFHDELLERFDDYLDRHPWKIFLIRALNHDNSPMNFLAAEYELQGYRVWRAPSSGDRYQLERVLHGIETQLKETSGRNGILMIDHMDEQQRIWLESMKKTAGPIKRLPVVAGGGRWIEAGGCYDTFYPPLDHNEKYSTSISLAACLKDKECAFDSTRLCKATGGDPQLIHLHLKYAVLKGGLDLFARNQNIDLPVTGVEMPERDVVLSGIFDSLRHDQVDILKKLSAWGPQIPMLILGALEPEEQRCIDALIGLCRLRSNMSAVGFASEDARGFVYSSLKEEERKKYHNFWALAVESRLTDSDDYLEYAATHWDRAGDLVRGYKANLEAAREFLRREALAKASLFADRLVSLAAEGGGSKSEAAAMSAAVFRARGDYTAARRKYVELLRYLRRDGDKVRRASAYKELGDLCRSIKKTHAAIYYAKKARALYSELADDQGIADCDNNIGLAHWVDERYDNALESFSRAFEKNKQIGNAKELAKIRSNQGIIKDITGRTGEVAELFLQARSYAAEAGDPRREAVIANNLGYFFIRQGEFQTAIRHLNDSYSISEKIGYAEGSINSLTNLGLCYLRSGDLLIAIDYSQKALETAESLGSRHLAASAEIQLAEASILMGNFALADEVLRSIEKSKAYVEDRSLRPQAGLLRSKLNLAVGKFDQAARSADNVCSEAQVAGDTRLELESRIALAEAIAEGKPALAESYLSKAAERASALGHNDLASEASILLAAIHLAGNDLSGAEIRLEPLLSAADNTRENYMKAGLVKSELLFRRGEFDDAISILHEIESVAAVSGFTSLAFKSSVILGEIFSHCSKPVRAAEALERANSYKNKLLSAMPDNGIEATICNIPFMNRLESVCRNTAGREFLFV